MINIQQACSHLSQGGILIYPTDTVYGLGCLPSHKEALNHLLTLKKRKRQFILIIEKWEQHLDWIDEPIAKTDLITETPTTWLFQASNIVPDELLSPNNEVAMRLVSHSPTKELLSNLSEPLISTSANLPGLPPIKEHQELISSFNLPILEGPCGGNPPSTIIRYSDKKVIRP